MLKRSVRGFTLVEVLVSIVVGAEILLALTAPLTVGLINRRQGQDLTQATNLAQAEIEIIRGLWQDPTPVVGTSQTVGQQNFDSNALTIAWNVANASSPCAPTPGGLLNAYQASDDTLTANTGTNPPVLSNPSQLTPNSATIPSSVRAIAIDSDGKCVRDYWGQIILGNAPDASGGQLTETRRVVVRIFRKQADPTALSYTPVNPPRTLYYNGSGLAQTNGVSNLNLPIAVVIADIPRS